MKKTVLITGAGGNLGRVAVARFLKEGWRVIASVSPGKSWPEIESNELHTYAIDLRDEDAVWHWLQSIIAEFGQLHAALLLAGGFKMGSVADTSGEDIRQMYSLNFETAYHVARPVFLHMKDQRTGRIILIGARPSLELSGKNKLAYALSKSLLIKLAEYLNAEGATQNVVTYLLVPDTLDTEDNRLAMPKADFKKWISPEKMADWMIRLCNEDVIQDERIVKLF